MDAVVPSKAYTIESISYTIPSSRPEGEPHRITVDPTDGRMACTCPARKQCWAQKAIAAGVGPKPRVRVRLQPPRRPVPTVTTAEVNDALYGGA